MIEWSTVLQAMSGGRRLPLKGRVTAHRVSQIHIGHAGGVPFMPVFLHPEGLDLIRDAGSLRLNRVDGTPHFLSSGGRAWDFSKDAHRPTTAESRFVTFVGPGYELVSASESADELLGAQFPSGPVRDDTRLGRPVWVVPGAVDGVEAEITVDQQSGVVLAVTALDGDWSAEFISIEFPVSIDPANFRWAGESTDAMPLETVEREDGAWATEDVALPESEVPHSSGRVLSVRMQTWLIEDGTISHLRVGETVQWELAFSPADDESDTDPATVTLLAEATAAEGEPPHTDWQGVLRWPTHLQGDGWSAAWGSDRPAIGAVSVRGQLRIDEIGQPVFPARQVETRGRVSRIRIQVEKQRKGTSRFGNNWEVIPDSRRWIDVQIAPHAFGMPEFAKVRADGTREYPVDVIVELDLDAAAPLEQRPSVVPGCAVARDRTLWVADRQLPVVVSLDLESGSATETVLPLPVATQGMFSSGQLSVRPDDAGCWVVSGDTRYRIERDSAAAIADPEPLGQWSACAYDGRTMLVLGESSVLIDGNGHRRLIELPEWQPGPLVAHRRSGDPYFVAALRKPDVPMRPGSGGGFRARYVYRIATIEDNGEVTVGPEVEFNDRVAAIGIVDGRIWVVAAGAVHTMNEDLTLDTVRRLPAGMVLEAGFVSDQMWILIHHPDGTTGPGWRTNSENSDSLSDEDGHWLFVLLGLPSLEPVGAMGVDSNYLDVTSDADGTAWVPGPQIRGLRTDGTVARIDVARALESTRKKTG